MDQELVSELYTKMLRIRHFEEEAARLHQAQKIAGPLHLYSGQEAVAVGTLSVLEGDDAVISSFRCMGHFLAQGGSTKAGFAELMGKEAGCSKGRGGSMHLFDTSRNFFGGWQIIGSQIPVAAGLAFAQKYKDSNAVTICFFGDGAINIGAFHEGLALAALWKLPVVFIIENNRYAMHTPVEKSFPIEDLSVRALAYPMARDTVEGHDVFAVRGATHTAIRRAREQKLPTLIEAKTVRLRGFSVADATENGSTGALNTAKEKDPIIFLEQKMENLGMEKERDRIQADMRTEIEAAVQFAENAPEPTPSGALDYTYSEE
ncbi:thiamine pyrophosphate-dependent enzyme [Oligoflexia bacterium]|nr:thiamine pyrophosphate-dependent enzyme [Oligoflexia bacterium]